MQSQKMSSLGNIVRFFFYGFYFLFAVLIGAALVDAVFNALML